MSGKLLKNKAAGKFWETDISDEQLEAELLTGREERICRLEQMIVKQTMPKPVPKDGTTPLQLPQGGEKSRQKISQEENTSCQSYVSTYSCPFFQ